ncbi:MAG: hypothetical protein L6Q59_09670 [Ignavibacteriaceae bacterium]|nr:hypothetical protein [Ignavibacteriaceae bacterium]
MQELREIKERYIPENRILRWLLVIAGGELFLIAIQYLFSSALYLPFRDLAGAAIVQARDTGSSLILSDNNFNIVSHFLMTVILVYLILPAIFHASFGDWFDYQNEEPVKVNLRLAFAGLVLTTVFMLNLAALGWVDFLLSGRIYKSFNAQMLADYSDDLLGIALQEKGLELKMMTGGNIAGFSHLSDTDINSKMTGKYFQATMQSGKNLMEEALAHRNLYLLRNAGNDSTWHLIAISEIRSPDPQFQNADGRRGYLQRTLEITPSGQRILYLPGS